MEKLNIAMLQTDIVWADPQKNRDKAAALMDSAPDACLYILPEMFSTGFCTSPEGIAEEEPSTSLEWMKSQAAARKAAIAGSIVHSSATAMSAVRTRLVMKTQPP